MKINMKDMNSVKKYAESLRNRTISVEKKFISYFLKSLYQNTPKQSGTGARSWMAAINSPDAVSTPYFLNPETSISALKLGQTVYVTNVCGYLKYVNDGTANIAPTRFIELSFDDSFRKLNQFTKEVKGNE